MDVGVEPIMDFVVFWITVNVKNKSIKVSII